MKQAPPRWIVIGLGLAAFWIAFFTVSRPAPLPANCKPRLRSAALRWALWPLPISGALTATMPLAWLVTQMSWRHVFVAIGIASFVIAMLTGWLMRVISGIKNLQRNDKHETENRDHA